MQSRPIKTIAIFPKVQPDTVAAILLLKDYGEKHFPGIARAEVVFWTALPAGQTAEQCEAAGILPIDLGGGTFDHHHAERGEHQESAATLVAKYLGVEKDPALQKLLAYAKRDDLEGKGTISEDPLDRAFGLSGLITTYGRMHKDEPAALVVLVLPLLRAHVAQERQRYEENPKEWKALKAAGRGQEFRVKGQRGIFAVAVAESDNISLPGFLRAYFQADVVIQRLSSGHVNIITNQKKQVDLRPVAAAVRAAEAEKLGVKISAAALAAQGRVSELPMWFFDVMATTLQNGGVDPQDIPPTSLTLEEIIAAVKKGLAEA
ncbi:hypothetical protein EPN90_01705 [Patescibacteria group bacterium]|nr:MAG: hypothetical protein EPN90_01705 [Patescibacteria group bacterium]